MSDPHEQLRIATAARRPIPLEVERLVTEAQRAPGRHYDEIDLACSDPLVERFARPRKESQAAKVLDILDQLERSRG
jgi:hypothetical protein